MPLKQIQTKRHKAEHLGVLAKALSYRIPAAVTRMLRVPSGDYPVCPRCGSSFDREYIRFCDRCGQRLNWSVYQFAIPVKPGEK